ncbi:acyl-[acyl-carrier-protein] thioesterase [Desemzia sp. FAM 23989]|uniref:acyl-[acyl-carrier-protein] thioesterase n=1 Tax=Desemzia sp. FAM 23989 TaxID=3259523 RepID=UPI00388B9C44
MSGKIYEAKHLVKYYECDTNKRMTLPMLVNIMIHASGEQSHLLGVGDDVVNEMGLSWVILQYEMNFNRVPEFAEEVTITTQALSYNKLFCYREFKVYGANGEECVTAKTTFALIDREKRKMARIPEEIVAPYEVEFNKKLVRTTKPEKVGAEATSTEYRVRFLDIDRNQHVNNSKYFDWALDTLDYEFLTSHDLDYVNIKFEKEVHYGNMITSSVSVIELEDGRVSTAHKITTGETVNCELSIIWK